MQLSRSQLRVLITQTGVADSHTRASVSGRMSHWLWMRVEMYVAAEI